jgi:hypothetical protein
MPLHEGDTWELRSRNDDRLIGTLTLKNADFPWVICDFRPTEAFETYRELFAQDDEILDRLSSDPHADWTEYDHLYDRITGALKLVAIGDANPVEDFLLHIYDDEACFRH